MMLCSIRGSICWTKDGMELNCTFGMVMTNFLTYLWNLRITFPNRDIAIHANNVKSCFWQLKHHPNVISFIINTILFLQCKTTFGLDFIPANWETAHCRTTSYGTIQ